MSTNKQTIAFFGATGGVAGTTLAAALRNGHTCTALVRTPEKLRTILTTEHSIPASTLDSQFTIHTGHIRDATAISAALKSPLNPSALVDTIYFGVGSTPKFQASLISPFTLHDPTICKDGITGVLQGLDLLFQSGISYAQDGRKPLLIAIAAAQKVPTLMAPIYYWIGHIAHEDKLDMERILFGDGGKHARDVVIMRPTLFVDGEPRGLESVKVGWEWGNKEDEIKGRSKGHQRGYSVGRKDVGEWVFQKVISGGEEEWKGKTITLCY